MEEDAMVDLLRQVKKVLDEHGVEFWLDCGTLLGAVREGRFLTWEHDIDLGAWHERVSDDLKISVSKKLRDRGFRVHIYEYYMNIRKEETVADINFYGLNNDNAIYHQLIDPLYKFLNYFSHVLSAPHDYEVYIEKSLKKRLIMWSIIYFSRIMPSFLRKRIIQVLSAVYNKIRFRENLWVVPSSYFSGLSTIKIYGMELKVPAKTEEYLAYRYGEDWSIPKRDWRTSRDDGTVAKIN